MKQNNKADFLGTEKIPSLLFKLSFPAMIGMMVMVLYNVIDTIFVGKLVGSLAIAGIAVVMPIVMLIATIGMAIGVGGASIISRALGAKENEKANHTFTLLSFICLFIGFTILIPGYIYREELLFVFGGKGQILQHASVYYNIVIAGSPVLGLLMMTNNFIRAEGKAKLAMITMIASSIINIILDYLFLFVFRWGLEGAAYATVLSQLLVLLYIIYFYNSGNSILRFKFKLLYWDWNIFKESFLIGFSTFARHAANSLLAAILNHSLFMYGGELSVAVFGVIHRILMFVVFPMIGIVQGMMPISGFNLGAGKLDRVKKTLRLSILSASILSFAGFVLIYFLSENIMRLFSSEYELISQGDSALKIIIMAFSLVGIQMIGSSFFQAIGKAFPALLLTLSRQVLFLIPLIIILPLFYGLSGIWYAFPLSDLFSFTITTLFLKHTWKKLKKNIHPV